MIQNLYSEMILQKILKSHYFLSVKTEWVRKAKAAKKAKRGREADSGKWRTSGMDDKKN